MNFFTMLLDIFRRASAKQPLTAAERGFRDGVLRWLVYQIFTALVAGGQAVLPLLSHWNYQWTPVLLALGGSTLYAFMGAVWHAISSLGDGPLADALGILTNLTKQFATGGTAAMLATLNQTDRTNFVLKMIQGLMQLQAPAAPAQAPAPAPSPQIIVVPSGAPVPGSPMAAPFPPSAK